MAESKNDRRLRRVRFTPGVLAMFITEGAAWRVIENGLPEQWKIVGADIDRNGDDPNHHTFEMVVQSDIFDVVSDGAEIPEHPSVRFGRVRSARR